MASRSIRLTHKGDRRCGEPVEYGDVAILLRAHTGIQRYEEAFAHEGIPHYVVGGGRGYFARHEIRDVRNALIVVDSPIRDVAVAASLRSPFVGVSAETLYRIGIHASSAPPHESGKREKIPLFVAIQDDELLATLPPAEQAVIKRFVNVIISLQRRDDRHPVGQLLDQLISMTGYDARLLSRPNGRRRLANVRKLLQIANSERTLGVPAFIRRLEAMEKLSDREGDAPTEEREANVVRFYTMHNAKGLEFPVVILADLSYPTGSHSDPLVVCDPATLSLGGRFGSGPDMEFAAAKSDRERRDREESTRLLYVAMTRAREHLILSGNLGTGYKGSSTWMNDIAQTLGVLSLPDEPERRKLLGGVEAILTPMIGLLR